MAGREGAGKTLAGHQFAVELARGYGNLVADGISPQNVIIIDYSAREANYRYFKYTKQRKAALPDEVLEVVISEDEYLHFEIVGNASEADVKRNQNNLRRFGQITEAEDGDEEDETPKEDGRGNLWTDKDTEQLRDLASTLETPAKETIGQMMERHPNLI